MDSKSSVSSLGSSHHKLLRSCETPSDQNSCGKSTEAGKCKVPGKVAVKKRADGRRAPGVPGKRWNRSAAAKGARVEI